jgi:hypothetical protein
MEALGSEPSDGCKFLRQLSIFLKEIGRNADTRPCVVKEAP